MHILPKWMGDKYQLPSLHNTTDKRGIVIARNFCQQEKQRYKQSDQKENVSLFTGPLLARYAVARVGRMAINRSTDFYQFLL